MTTLTIDATIDELVLRFPDVDYDELDHVVLVELATRYLRAERNRRFDVPHAKTWNKEDGEKAVRVLNYRSDNIQRRAKTRSKEQIMFDRERVQSAVSNRVAEIVTAAKQTIQNTWLPSLLGESFQLPDGTVVKWADATVEQHRLRANHLSSSVSTTLETISLHHKAIDDIKAAGAENLGAALEKENAA